MEWLRLLVSAGLYLSITEGVQMCQVEEGNGITLNCTGIKSNGTLIWSRRDGNSIRTMASCLPGKPCYMSYPSYTATVTGFNDSHWISFFNITEVARIDQGLWTCHVESQNITSACDLKVFARPISVNCSQPQLQNGQVIVVCTGEEEVFPDPSCYFSWYKNNSKEETSLVGAVVNPSSSEQGNPSYFYPTCTWNISVQSLGFGSHQFKVLVYPNVTGTNADMDYGANSSLTSPVYIMTPDVTFESCPVGQVKDGFIQEGTTASCTCRETNNKFLLANTSWSVSQGDQLTWEMQNSTLTFLAKKNSQNFTCQADVLGKSSMSEIYVPQVAFGPNQIVVKVKINNTDKDLIDLCGKPQNVNISIYCAASDVSPDAILQYFINEIEVQDGFSRMLEISKSGHLSAECKATNSKFGTLSVRNTTFIEVTGGVDDPVNYTGAIVGGVVAGLVVIILIAVIIFRVKRKGNTGMDKHGSPGDSEGNTGMDKHGSPGDSEVVVENTVYGMGSREVVVFDNSDIYNINKQDEVLIDNSYIYNESRHNEKETQKSAYKNYSEITPTITSATAIPKNMKTYLMVEEPNVDNPYEDVDAKTSKPKMQQKPKVATKSKPNLKTKPPELKSNAASETGKTRSLQIDDDGMNQTYSIVNKVAKSGEVRF